jgi:hypothetical protein
MACRYHKKGMFEESKFSEAESVSFTVENALVYKMENDDFLRL